MPGPKTLTYGYDLASNLTSLTDQGGTITYTYNTVDLLDTMTVPSAGTIGFTYQTDFDHRRLQINYPNQLTQHFEYDDSNRVTRAKATNVGGTIFDLQYSFANGGDTSLRRTMTEVGIATTTYDYDPLSRLARHERSSADPFEGKVYTYDKNSNRCAMKVETASQQAAPVCNGGPDPNITYYSHGLADELQARTNSGGTTSFLYDENGNETSASGVRSAETYNSKDQLTSITPQGQSPIPMSYTGPGQFERVTRGTSSFTTGALGLSREQNGGTTDFAYEPDEGLLLVTRSSSGVVGYPLYDGLGSVVATGTASGGASSVARYDPFGACLANCPTGPHRWLGGLGVVFDSATSLHKMGTRYYDPALGRFTQVDPVGGGSANAYDYAVQDPINVVDPEGTDPWGRDDYRRTRASLATRRALLKESKACKYCGRQTTEPGKAQKGVRRAPTERHFDHVKPISEGGTSTKGNIVVSCAQCNLEKGPRTPRQWGPRWYFAGGMPLKPR